MNRRKLISSAFAVLGLGGLAAVFGKNNLNKQSQYSNQLPQTKPTVREITMAELKNLDRNPETVSPIHISDDDWDKYLASDAYNVLREEGTERAGTSTLNAEKREGQYLCAGCGLALFNSNAKYESGTGWPSFFEPIEGRLGTKTDFKIGYPRKEYHCARCGGHQGHIFKDGPQPTGLRYCNNGVALKFSPKDA